LTALREGLNLKTNKMKNIHVLPTDKPSRLIINWEKDLCYKSKPYLMEGTQNIYITSDEEIKEGDYWIYISPPEWKDTDRIEVVKNVLPNSWFCKLHDKENYKNVILTTDQDLINDGLQAIDDEFLEWYVKNPSCEEVEVKSKVTKDGVWTDLKGYVELPTIHSISYKIIIPKKEPKTDYSFFIKQKEEDKKKHIVMLVGDKVNDEQTKCYCGHTTYCDCGPEELELTQLEILKVPMPIQNKSISSWNKSNTNPNFDGEYLCYISCREECGNVHRYYKVVSNTFNTWVINKNERVALWKELPKNPFND
jgi:hypothetical protein